MALKREFADGRGPMDRPTDKPSYRYARAHFKSRTLCMSLVWDNSNCEFVSRQHHRRQKLSFIARHGGQCVLRSGGWPPSQLRWIDICYRTTLHLRGNVFLGLPLHLHWFVSPPPISSSFSSFSSQFSFFFFFPTSVFFCFLLLFLILFFTYILQIRENGILPFTWVGATSFRSTSTSGLLWRNGIHRRPRFRVDAGAAFDA